MGVTAAVLAVVGTAASIQQQKKAQKSSAKAAKAERAKTRAESARQRRQQLRQARLSQGEALNLAAVTGGLGSSGLAGAQASIQTQLGTNLSFLDTTENLTIASNKARQDAANFLGNAQIFSQIANVSSSFAGGSTAPKKPAPITTSTPS